VTITKEDKVNVTCIDLARKMKLMENLGDKLQWMDLGVD
jgi:hypothetical protein